jgi:peptide/nickel transport system substrate-binding protein
MLPSSPRPGLPFPRRRFLALSAGGALLAACRARPTPRSSDTLTLAVRSDVTGFYPSEAARNEAFTTQVNWNAFEGLVCLDPQLRLHKGLAAHWSNPDDHTYLFEMAPGLRFSDGTPVEAADAVASILGARRTAYRDYFHAITNARVTGEHRLEVITRGPYLVLLTRLPWAMVLPRREWERPAPAAIGTGPYRLAAWKMGESIRFEQNPHFRGPAPTFRNVTYLVLPDEAARVEAVRSGRADAADQVPLGALRELAAAPGMRVLTGEGLRVMYLALRPGAAPFDDPRVREAVDLAIDREDLIHRALGDQGSVATQLVPPPVVGYNPDIPRPLSNRSRARALLAEAGHPQGFEVDLHGPNNRYVNDLSVLDELARQLLEVGIRVRLHAMDKVDFFRLTASGGTRMHLIGWSCETAEAGDVLDSVGHSKDATGLGADNDMDLSDDDLDRNIGEANASATAVERTRLLQKAMARLQALRVYLPLYVQPESALFSDRIAWDAPPNFAFVPAAMGLVPGA